VSFSGFSGFSSSATTRALPFEVRRRSSAPRRSTSRTTAHTCEHTAPSRVLSAWQEHAVAIALPDEATASLTCCRRDFPFTAAAIASSVIDSTSTPPVRNHSMPSKSAR